MVDGSPLGACSGEAEAARLPGPATSGTIAIPAALRMLGRARVGPVAAVPTPARVGPYYILRRLMMSDEAALYRAVDSAGARVVLKAAAPAAGWAADARLKREGELLGRLAHRGIVRLLDHGLDDAGRPWFAMPDLQGGDFEQALNRLRAQSVLRRRDAILGESLPLFLAACSAVAAAHAQGVWHLDLKPGHLMLEGDGQPVVVDWGIAREAGGPPGRPGLVLGTPGYMAPEQCLGHDRADARSDVWSLGAILYELLTYRRAVPSGEVDRMLSVTRARLPVPPQEATAGLDPPDAICEVCLRALALDPAERPADAQALHEELVDAMTT